MSFLQLQHRGTLWKIPHLMLQIVLSDQRSPNLILTNSMMLKVIWCHFFLWKGIWLFRETLHVWHHMYPTIMRGIKRLPPCTYIGLWMLLKLWKLNDQRENRDGFQTTWSRCHISIRLQHLLPLIYILRMVSRKQLKINQTSCFLGGHRKHLLLWSTLQNSHTPKCEKSKKLEKDWYKKVPKNIVIQLSLKAKYLSAVTLAWWRCRWLLQATVTLRMKTPRYIITINTITIVTIITIVIIVIFVIITISIITISIITIIRSNRM